jgi:simple sugar transport system substrate-binding protein
VAAGIPVVTTNSGSNLYKEFGAFTHIGQDEFTAGAGAGERYQAAGVKSLLCVKQEQTNTGLDARCDGAKSTFKGEFDVITTSGDASGKQQADVKAALDARPEVDAVFGTGPVVAHDSSAAAKELGRTVMVGGVDLSTDILKDIAAGDVAFTIDQQQYLQGYVSVLALYLNATNQNTLGGGLPINTGPGFVTKDNAETVAKLVEAGTR